MMDVVDIEAIAQLECGEYVGPKSADLSCYIYPKTLNAHIVNAPADVQRSIWL